MEQVKATLEWHYYCPKCERSCLTRFSGNYGSWINVCSDCGETYQVCPTQPAPDAGDSAAFLNLFYPIFNLLNQARRNPPQRR